MRRIVGSRSVAAWRLLPRNAASSSRLVLSDQFVCLASTSSLHIRPFSVSLRHSHTISSTTAPTVPSNPDQGKKLAHAARIANYEFKDPERWLWEALQGARSDVLVIRDRAIDEGNKRLALLGDKVIGLVIVQNVVEANDYRVVADRQLKSMAINDNFAALCDRIGLTACINLNSSQILAGKNVKATTVEALIGAVFLDSGKDLNVAHRVMKHIGILEAVGAAQPIRSGDAAAPVITSAGKRVKVADEGS